MAKHGKKADPNAETQRIIKLRDYQRTEAHIEYDEDEAEGEARLKKMRIPKAVYRVAVILLVLILGLAVWVNRESLQPENVISWVKLQFVGSDLGDGFPVAITGSSVSTANFTAYSGDAYVLSDTAMTMLDSTGNELLSLRHSFNQPAMNSSHGKTLMYNQGSTGYIVMSGGETVVSQSADREILCGTVAANGRYALGLWGSDCASELQVFQKDGSLQFQYSFAKDYITAIAMNYDGTYGFVCTVTGDSAELVTKITVFDFNNPTPIGTFETTDNFIVDASWTDGGDLFAVGFSGLIRASSSNYQFTEYDYGGRELTAYRLDQGRAFLSISAYKHAGPSTLLAFRGSGEPIQIEADERIVSISAYGGTVATLAGSSIGFYDYSTGERLGTTDSGSDAKSIALANEKTAYVLGVSEVRMAAVE